MGGVSIENRPGPEEDPDFDAEFEVRRMHPFQARKLYLCPGCQQEIRPGLGHLVVVPRHQPDERRHWHQACWEQRSHRRPGR
jgi:hypothetical protein